ncbi:MAG TPA: NYN domain-containing protein [Anaerolineae bacterium]|nr:NYN domain-containing protein [Anaerolineae bacterium]HRT30942.1 NYN domain-containing protein [Anaerolineae bacterium]HXK42099.1 NYN domain-containing protein [Anaerolineae bacterium]
METVADSLTNERVALFIDFHNTRNALQRNGLQIDLVSLRNYLAEGRHLVESFVYIATHPLPDQQQVDQEAQLRLRQHGFLIQTKPGRLLPNGRLKCDFDLEMALDVQEFVARTRPDIVVLVTGDGDFTPLVERLRFRGIRVEVASVPGSIARSLQVMANGFVDLTQISEPVQNLQLPRPEPELVQPEPQSVALEEALLPA